MSAAREALRIELAEDLRVVPAVLCDQTSLIDLVLDSMHAMRWLNTFRKRGFKVTMRELYLQPTLAGWQSLLDEKAPAHTPARQPPNAVALPTMRDGQDFPLTPVQHAYLVGRDPGQVLGGVGCHLYQEFDGPGREGRRLEAAALREAVRALRRRHPMLCTAFRADGTQRYIGNPDDVRLAVHDLRDLGPEAVQRRLLDLRERLGHRQLAVERGETLDLQLSLLPDDTHRLHVNLDLLVADAASFTLLFDELAALVAGRDLSAVPADYDFRSYIADLAQRTDVDRQAAEAFWRRRLDDLPAAPSLPLARDPSRHDAVRIKRRTHRIDGDDWQQFAGKARAGGVTPTMALATGFGQVIGRWSGQARLLLNLTLFDRQPLHPAVERMIADFTTILLLDLNLARIPFLDLVRRNQTTFAEAHEHRHRTGVEVARDLKRAGRHPHGAPVVFTSALGRPLFGEASAEALGDPGAGISQTPQVWIDHLVYEHAGAVHLQWDSNDALFPEHLVAGMFDGYVDLVRGLIADESAWDCPLPDALPPTQLATRRRVNATAAEQPAGLLHDGIFARGSSTPDAVAVIHGEDTLNYADLCDLAERLAASLAAEGVERGDHVAICMDKGLGQIVAALGILYAGGIYVPVASQQPEERRKIIYDGAGIDLVLTCATEEGRFDGGARRCLTWQRGCQAEPLGNPVQVSADQAAYVIYTSGSTGLPKGVVISHAAALNTCADVTRRNAVLRGDRVLALSALHFDLSVYDMFGVLGAGGAMVLVDEGQRRDPAAWCRAIRDHGVTVWNTVPALFDMLLTYAEGLGIDAPSALRLVLLSGDWIGLDLPGRYRRFRADGRLVAMGGATEAAIWSNAFVVEQVDPAWRSIPYGLPLANQTYRVVDPLGRDCPDCVPGELWVGGAGVAQGYLNAPERTAAQFVAQDGLRWYRTGDFGCYWADGTLEFLGRRDRQVKVGGHRIELGEIDTALQGLPGIRRGVTLALGERDKRLVAYVELESDSPATSGVDLGAFAAPFSQASEPFSDVDTDARVAGFLVDHLARVGVDFATPVSYDDVAAIYGAAPPRRPLMRRWLDFLLKRDVLARADDGRLAQGPAYVAGRSDDDPDLATHHGPLRAMLRGDAPQLAILDHPVLSPEALQQDAVGCQTTERLVAILRDMAERLGRPVRFLDTNVRGGIAAERLLTLADPSLLAYLGIDTSQDMVLRARERLAAFSHAEVVNAARAASRPFHADLIWIGDHLHRLDDPQVALRDVLSLAAEGAVIVIAERHRATALALIGADLLEAHGLESKLRDLAFWRNMCERAGLTELHGDEGPASSLLILRRSAHSVGIDASVLAALAKKLPTYMVPQRLHILDTFPLTANGKIDHAALAALETRGIVEKTVPAHTSAPQGDAEQALAALWSRLLDSERVHRRADFFADGGDSLLATRMIGELAKLGYAAELRDLFEQPVLADFAARLRRAAPSEAAPSLRADSAGRFEPFPLTEVQQAYVVGRSPDFPLGGVGAHFFVEFEVVDLDLGRLTRVWNALIARHDTLRTVVRDDRQVVLPDVPPFAIACHDVADLAGDALALRTRLSHQVLDPERWPVFAVEAARDGSGRSRIYVGLDNLLLDGLSMQILLAELEQLYLDETALLPPIGTSFREYVTQHGTAAETVADRAYWADRLPHLPPAPQLALRADPRTVRRPVFARRSARLEAADWAGLKRAAAARQVTPSTLLLSCYAATLGAASARPELTLNLTLFDRAPVHPHIDRVLGDFTTLLPLAWEPADDLEASARALQRRLGADLSHRRVSVLRLFRDLAADNPAFAGGVPVVFTSALGFDTSSFLNHASWLKPRWGISQTPQVWLDHQVYESDGALCFNWDFVEALFAAETIDGMFGRYVELLRRIAGDVGAWTQALDALVPRQATIVPFAPRPVAIATVRSATSADVEIVTRLFGGVVGQPIGPAQNFFEAGASSLQLVKLHAALRRHGHEIEVIDLFAHPTPRALAARIAGAVDSAGPDGGVTGADRAAAAAPAIDRTPALQRRRDRLQRRLEQRR